MLIKWFINLNFENISYCGTIIKYEGIIWAKNRNIIVAYLPLNFFLAKTYPANIANSVEKNDAVKDTIELFIKYFPKLTNSNSFLYPYNVGLVVQYLMGNE